MYMDAEGRRMEHQMFVARMSRELTTSEIESGRLNARWGLHLPARLQTPRLPRLVRGLPLVRRFA